MKIHVYIYISDSLCCVAEINSVLNRLYFGRKISLGKLKEQNLSNLGVGEYFLFFFFFLIYLLISLSWVSYNVQDPLPVACEV